MSSPASSRPGLDEKDVIPTGETRTTALDVDLVHYPGQSSGRLILDPKSFGFFVSYFSLLITHPSERRESSLVMRLPHASSFPRTENLSCGLSRPMTQRTLKTS